eukprot:1104793-Pelagomonas_calceolata.AAC.1
MNVLARPRADVNALPLVLAQPAGGDSGIGRSVAVHFAREGAKGIAIAYKASQENQDAKETVELVEKEGSKCLAMQNRGQGWYTKQTATADVGDPDACKRVVDATVTAFGQIDVLVNNAAEQASIADMTLLPALQEYHNL